MVEIYFADLLNNIESVYLLGLVIISYLIMEYFPARLIFGKLFLHIAPSLSDEDINILAKKYGGFLWLGIIPAIIWTINTSFSLTETGLSFSNPGKTLLWTIILLPLPVIINFFAAKSKKNLELYPLTRLPVWDTKVLMLDMGAWVFYLIGYEYFFRGLLLFGLIPYTGVWVAVSINVMAYAFVHITKGGREALGAIPMGILLCLVTLNTGNIFAAFMIHLTLALSNELFSLHYHTEISYKRKR